MSDELVTVSDDAVKQRLMITKMELHNFKSYASTRVIGPFDKNMTSVVGPNGSGKSNVIDAMLFVFGFKAKQMRQNKVSELIHSSEKHPNLPYAKVSVYFQDIIDQPDGSYVPVAGSELIVAREARRDNSSRYWLDDKVSTYTEVTALLRTRGIDLDHNRFLILQGEVEQIAMMKPKAPNAHEDGLLEYLEDIIGSNKYVKDIDEAHAKMEELNELRTSKLNAVKASEQQVVALEERKAEAEEYLRLEGQLNSSRSAFYQKNSALAAAYSADIEQKRDEEAARLADEQSKLGDNEKQLGVLEKEYKKCKREHAKVSDQLEKSREAFQEFEREDIKHIEELKHQKKQKKKEEDAADKDKKVLGEVRAEVSALSSDVPRIEADIAANSELVAREEKELEAMYESLKGQTEPLCKDIEKKQREREPHAQELAAIKAEGQLAESEKQLLVDKQEAASGALAEAEAELASHATKVERSREELGLAKEAQQALSARLAETQAKLARMGGEEEALLCTARSTRAKYEEAMAARNSESSRSGTVSALMAAKRDIPGIIGRLGDLGSISDQYDVAISTACGALDQIVVQDTASAQACVELLRKRKLGVMTFLILDRQQHLAPRMSGFKAPAKSKRLFDLIEVSKPELRVAFYSAIRDTLVVEDKALATKIALDGPQRHRVVATDGTIIEASGTLSGGGKPMRGRMSGAGVTEAMSDAQIEALLSEAQKASAAVDELRAASAAGQAEARAVQKELAGQSTKQKKLQAALDAASAQAKALDAAVGLAKEGGLSDEEAQRIAELDAVLAKIGKRVDAQAKKVAVVEEQLEELQEQVLSIGGVKLRTLKSTVETRNEQVANAQHTLDGAKGRLANAEKRRATLEASEAKHRKAAEAIQAKMDEAKAHAKELEGAAKEVLDNFETCQANLEEKNEALQAMSDEYEKVKADVAKVRSVKVDLEAKIDDYNRAIRDNEHKAKHWAAKLAALREAAVGRADDPAGEGGEAGESSAAAGGNLADLSVEEIDEIDLGELQADIAKFEEALQGMSGNLGAIAEYKARERDWRARMDEFDAVTLERDGQRKTYESLRKQRLDEFSVGFRIIGMKLKEMYQMITLGGDAELERLDSLDPFSEGIVFSVRPPKKSWKNISNLSGGEKTLASLALVFALHHYKPTPLYVMDEIDAALDFRNVSIVGNYIKERTRNAQFIIISLRNNMFELADRLVGIYKTSNASNAIAIDPTAFTIAAR